MASVTANVAYSGQVTEDGTVSVFGRGKCTVALSGDFGSGTVTINQDVNGSWVPMTDNGADVTATADNDYQFEFAPDSFHGIQVSLASSTSPDLGVDIAFDGEPPLT